MEQNPIVNLKAKNENDEIEVSVDYDYHSPFEDEKKNPQSVVVKQQLQDMKMKLDELDEKIESLENRADGIDYAVAAGSGIIAGVLDIFLVEDFSLTEANRWGNEKCSEIFSRFAGTSNAFQTLSAKYAKGLTLSGDIAKSPSMLGLIVSVFAGITGMTAVMGPAGVSYVSMGAAKAITGNTLFDGIFSGVKNWALCTATSGVKAKGVPSPVSRMLYEEGSQASGTDAATLLSLSDSGLSSQSYSFATELGVLKQVGMQAVPVIINEAVVRAFYFVRHLLAEIREKRESGSDKICWKNTVPFKNRTVARMITISTSVMSAIDIADSAVESVMTGASNAQEFLTHFVLKLNYVGLGRCIIAIGNDFISGGRLSSNRKKRSELRNDYLKMNNAQIFFKEHDVWTAAENTERVLDEAKAALKNAYEFMCRAKEETKKSMESITNSLDKAEEKNPGLQQSLKDMMSWE